MFGNASSVRISSIRPLLFNINSQIFNYFVFSILVSYFIGDVYNSFFLIAHFLGHFLRHFLRHFLQILFSSCILFFEIYINSYYINYLYSFFIGAILFQSLKFF